MINITTDKYEEALKKWARAKKNSDRGEIKKIEAFKILEDERSKLHIQCNCGSVTPVKDIPFLRECVSYSTHGDYDYDYKTSWICPTCGDEWNDIKTKEFPKGIEKYCKKIHKWEQYETKEVIELRARHRAKRKKYWADRAHIEKVEAAKKLLQKEGILE